MVLYPKTLLSQFYNSSLGKLRKREKINSKPSTPVTSSNESITSISGDGDESEEWTKGVESLENSQESSADLEMESLMEKSDPLALFAREGAELVFFNRIIRNVCEKWFNEL